MRFLFALVFGAIAPAVASFPASAQTPVVVPQTDAPPTELSGPIRAVMATGGQSVDIGGKTLEFWWVRGLPLEGATGEVSWAAVQEGTIVGAVRLSAPYHDIRGKGVGAGVYTLRYALQPENGDHLGVSPYREFLLLAPARVDAGAAALSHDEAVNLAKQANGTSHPAAWSLDPPIAATDPGTVYTNDTGLKGVVFSVPVSRAGKAPGMMRFGLILAGTIQP
jgi:hypothetical protein